MCKSRIVPEEKKYKCSICSEFDVCETCYEQKRHEHECVENWKKI